MTTLHDLTNSIRDLVAEFIQNQVLEASVMRSDRTGILLNAISDAVKGLEAIDELLDSALMTTLSTREVRNVDVGKLEAKIATIVARLQAATTNPSVYLAPLAAPAIVDEQEVARKILSHAAEASSLTVDQVLSPSRTGNVAMCRRTVFWLLRRHTNMTVVGIARFMKRDHSTVVYSIQEVDCLVSGKPLRRKAHPRKQRSEIRNRGMVVGRILQLDADAAEIRRRAQKGVRAPAETAERPNQESKPLHRQARGHSSTMVTTGGGHVKSGSAGNQSQRG